MHKFAELWVHKSVHIQELAILRLFPNLSFSCHDSGNKTEPTIPIISDTSVIFGFLPQTVTEFTVVVEHHFEKEFSLMVGQKNGNQFLLIL